VALALYRERYADAGILLLDSHPRRNGLGVYSHRRRRANDSVLRPLAALCDVRLFQHGLGAALYKFVAPLASSHPRFSGLDDNLRSSPLAYRPALGLRRANRRLCASFVASPPAEGYWAAEHVLSCTLGGLVSVLFLVANSVSTGRRADRSNELSRALDRSRVQTNPQMAFLAGIPRLLCRWCVHSLYAGMDDPTETVVAR